MCLILPATSAYSESHKYDLLKITTILVFHLCLGLPIIIFLSGICVLLRIVVLNATVCTVISKSNVKLAIETDTT